VGAINFQNSDIDIGPRGNEERLNLLMFKKHGDMVSPSYDVAIRDEVPVGADQKARAIENMTFCMLVLNGGDFHDGGCGITSNLDKGARGWPVLGGPSQWGSQAA
jgi:hypothetical protein